MDDPLATLERLAGELDRLDIGAVERARLVRVIDRIVTRVLALTEELRQG